jgi:hypothetical protein
LGGPGGGGGGGGSGPSGTGGGPGGGGGFGGGGGGGGAWDSTGFGGGPGGHGGNGGFAGGGGGGGGGTPDGAFGLGGFAGGNGTQANAGGNQGNSGGGGGGMGGAVFNSGGTITVTNSTFSSNAAVGGAGGSFLGVLGGPGSGFGGAFFNRNGSIIALNCTLANNRADQGGGGIYNLGDGAGLPASISLRNTIVARTPAAASDYAESRLNGGSTTNAGNNNLIQINSGFTGGVLSTADPRLGPLADNGGPTLTHALLNGSPAIDAGDNSNLPPTDQRGYPRFADGDGNGSFSADIGALEEGLFRLRTFPQTAATIQLSGFQLFLTGESNRLYVTEFSPDLTNWTGFATNQASGIEVPVLDTHTGAASKRFYRAHALP